MVADKGQFFAGFGFSGVVVRQDLLESGEVRILGRPAGPHVREAHARATRPIHRWRGASSAAGYTRDEVNVVYMGFPDMNVALANKAVDAAWQIEPLSTLGQERGIASKFAPGDELYPNQQIAVLFYSPEFAARTDAARAFMIGLRARAARLQRRVPQGHRRVPRSRRSWPSTRR